MRVRQELRLEEVLTFDTRRLHEGDNMSLAIQRYNTFQPDYTTIVTDIMFRRRIVYRLDNWNYFDRTIGRELFLLGEIARDTSFSSLPWTPPCVVELLMHAEFRAMYFVHGRSTVYEYAMCRRIFLQHGTKIYHRGAGFCSVRSLTTRTSTAAATTTTTNLPCIYIQTRYQHHT